MHLVWVTDPHLNHVSDQQRDRWFQQIASRGHQGVVISGDISEGDRVVLDLKQIADRLAVPIYFVLGNHDFYHSDFGHTRQRVTYACRDHPSLLYLTDQSSVHLGGDRYLIGEDGWADATEGDYENSSVQLNDFRLIRDFVDSDPDRWKQQLHELGAESAARLKAKLDSLPIDADDLLVVTHVPPFREACWYEGRTTDDQWAPFFVAGQLGSVLMQAAEQRPQRRIVVLCGHTHHAGVAQMKPNLLVYTGSAEYGQPKIEGTVQLTEQGLTVAMA